MGWMQMELRTSMLIERGIWMRMGHRAGMRMPAQMDAAAAERRMEAEEALGRQEGAALGRRAEAKAC